MLTTKIFPLTFRKFQKLINRNQFIQNQILSKSRNPQTQRHVANLYAITNLISKQLSDLQSDLVVGLLREFLPYKGMRQEQYERRMKEYEARIKEQGSGRKGKIKTIVDFGYNEERNNFYVKKEYKIDKDSNKILLDNMQKVKQSIQQSSKPSSQLQAPSTLPSPTAQYQTLQISIQIKNSPQQKYDHPSMRKSLYFYQLKDMDKHCTYEVLPNTPIFIQDMNRKKMEFQLLNKKNPLGVPQKAPAMVFDVELENKVYFQIKSTYEETIVKEIGRLRNKVNDQYSSTYNLSHKNKLKFNHDRKLFTISCLKVPSLVQNIIYNDIMKDLLQIDEQQILNFHKLSYVGGRIQKLNNLMDLHQTMSIQNQDFFIEKQRMMMQGM